MKHFVLSLLTHFKSEEKMFYYLCQLSVYVDVSVNFYILRKTADFKKLKSFYAYTRNFLLFAGE